MSALEGICLDFGLYGYMIPTAHIGGRRIAEVDVNHARDLGAEVNSVSAG